MAETLPTPVALMSYAQRDNQDGYLTELHSRLSREASLYIGADFEIFMDQASIELEQN